MRKRDSFDFSNKDEAEKLYQSYRAMRKGGIMPEVIDDDFRRKSLERIFRRNPVFDYRYKISFVNTFYFNYVDRDFYLIQVEIDFGFTFSPKYEQRN